MCLALSLLEQAWEAVWAGVGWRSRDWRGYRPFLCSWASPLGSRWGGRGGIQGSWGSDPTSSHLSTQPISELHMQCKHKCTLMFTHIFTGVHSHVHACVHINTFTCIYLTYMHSDVCICPMNLYTSVHTVTCIETCTHVHIHSCMHAQVQTSSGLPSGTTFSLAQPQARFMDDPSGLRPAALPWCQPPLSSRT